MLSFLPPPPLSC